MEDQKFILLKRDQEVEEEELCPGVKKSIATESVRNTCPIINTPQDFQEFSAQLMSGNAPGLYYGPKYTFKRKFKLSTETILTIGRKEFSSRDVIVTNKETNNINNTQLDIDAYRNPLEKPYSSKLLKGMNSNRNIWVINRNRQLSKLPLNKKERNKKRKEIVVRVRGDKVFILHHVKPETSKHYIETPVDQNEIMFNSEKPLHQTDPVIDNEVNFSYMPKEFEDMYAAEDSFTQLLKELSQNIESSDSDSSEPGKSQNLDVTFESKMDCASSVPSTSDIKIVSANNKSLDITEEKDNFIGEMR